MAGVPQKSTKKIDSDIIFDEKLLITVYDSSMKLNKEELAKRLAEAKNTIIEKNMHQDENSMSETDDDCETNVDPDNPNFTVGSYVRANYIDGVDYEAEIVTINEETGMCHIKYLGYGNEDCINMSDLLPTWGKKVRQKQVQEALKEKLSFDDTTHGPTENLQKKNVMEFYSKTIPPPPPMPPIEHILDSSDDDYEHLSAMLKSWYMSGYYTGVYQGVRMTKEQMKKGK